MAENNDLQKQRLLPLGQTPAASPIAKEPVSLDAKVDEWFEANPTNEFDPAKVEAQPQAEAVAEAPQAEVAPETPVTAPVVEAKADTTAPEVKPSVEAPVAEVKPVEATPAPEVKPPALDLNAKYTLVEGGEAWTGDQILTSLRTIQPLQEKASQADVYQEIFGLDAQSAKANWGPVMDSLRKDPTNVQLLSTILDDPEQAKYLKECSAYWYSPEAQAMRQQNQPAQQQSAPIDPALKAEIDALKAQVGQFNTERQNQRKQYFVERVSREMNQVFGQYPFLRGNPELVNDLLMTANALNGGDDSDNAKGILDALSLKKPLYDAMLIASSQPLVAAPAPVEVPPLLGSAGAAPQASRPQQVRPKKFSNLSDAVDDWVENAPSQYR